MYRERISKSHANDPPSEHRAILRVQSDQPRSEPLTSDAERRSEPPNRDAGVVIGVLRRDLPACLADVQRMASVQAVALASTNSTASDLPEIELTQRSADPCVEFDGHAICSSPASVTRPNPSRPSQNEVVRDFVSPSVPSAPNVAPGFRDRARFEWRVRQPSRRDSQCVPN